MRIDLVLENWTLFAEGVWITVQLTGLALLVGFCIALPAGMARARRLPWLSPLILVQTYLIYYGLSQFEFIRDSPAWTYLRDPWWCALIAFSLNSGAYSTEIIRGAIETSPKGEIEAALPLGCRRGRSTSSC